MERLFVARNVLLPENVQRAEGWAKFTHLQEGHEAVIDSIRLRYERNHSAIASEPGHMASIGPVRRSHERKLSPDLVADTRTAEERWKSWDNPARHHIHLRPYYRNNDLQKNGERQQQLILRRALIAAQEGELPNSIALSRQLLRSESPTAVNIVLAIPEEFDTRADCDQHEQERLSREWPSNFVDTRTNLCANIVRSIKFAQQFIRILRDDRREHEHMLISWKYDIALWEDLFVRPFDGLPQSDGF